MRENSGGDSDVLGYQPGNAPAGREAAPSRGYAWLVILMLWFICFLNYADRQSISSVLKKIGTEFQIDEFQRGLIVSAFGWVYAAGAPFAGFLADRFPRKQLILGGCLFWSLVTMSTGMCVNFWQFIGVRGAEGLGETFYFPASMSLVSDYHGRRTRSRAMAVHQSSVYAGTIAGGWFAGWAAEKYGWRLGFYVFGGLGIVLAAILYLFLREPRRGQSEGFSAETPLGVAATAAAIFFFFAKKPNRDSACSWDSCWPILWRRFFSAGRPAFFRTSFTLNWEWPGFRARSLFTGPVRWRFR